MSYAGGMQGFEDFAAPDFLVWDYIGSFAEKSGVPTMSKMIKQKMGISGAQDSWLAPQTRKTHRHACVLATPWCFRGHEMLNSH